MTDLGSSRPAVAPSLAAAYDPAPEPTVWTGWVVVIYALIVHGREMRSSRM